MPSSLGTPTQSIFLKEQADNIYQEFAPVSGLTVTKGMLIKIDPTTGLGAQFTSADDPSLCIGVAIDNTNSVEKLVFTVNTKGHCIIYGEAAAIQNAGAMAYTGWDTTGANNPTGTPLGIYGVAGTVGATIGWSLDVATTQYQIIRILVKY